MKRKLAIIIFVLFAVNNIIAQKNNYWSTSFNTEAALLAGAVVGGNSDLTSIYYNPAGISEIKDMKLALNTNLFNYSISTYKNALGKDVDINDYYFMVKPRFVSYLYRSKKDTSWSWQFAIYNKLLDDVSIYNSVQYEDKILYPQNEEIYNGNFDLRSELFDYRGGIGGAYMVNKKLSLGFSIIGMVKGIDYLEAIDVSLYPKNIPKTDSNFYFANWSYYEKIYMYDVRMLFRFGARYKINRIQLGLSTTMPSFRLWGNSDSKRRISQSNVKNDSISKPDYINVDAANYLYSEMKDPFSIAFGIMYSTPDKKTRLYFSTEYFAPIKTYKLIDGTKSVDDKNFEGDNFLTKYYQADQVINFGIGYQHLFSKRYEALLGFKTDFDPSAMELNLKDNINENFDNVVKNKINLYHLTAGTKINTKHGALTLGLEYSFGYAKNLTQYANFKDVDINSELKIFDLQGPINNDMKIFYNSFGLYLGISFGF